MKCYTIPLNYSTRLYSGFVRRYNKQSKAYTDIIGVCLHLNKTIYILEVIS